MARDEERQEPDPEEQEPTTPPSGEEGELDAAETLSTPEFPDNEPPQEEPQEEPEEAPEETADAGGTPPHAEEPPPESGTPPKPKSRGTGLLWFVLLLIVAAGGWGTWQGLGLFQQQRGDLNRMKTELNKMGSDIQELRDVAKQLPQENARRLEELVRRFEESQTRLATATEEQRQTLESLREEVDDLKKQVRIGTIQLKSTEEVPGAEGELEDFSEPVVKPAEEESGGEGTEPEEPTQPENMVQDVPTEQEPVQGSIQPTDKVTPGGPEDTAGEEAAPKTSETESGVMGEMETPTPPEEETASTETPVEEESAASGMETIVPKTGTDQPPPAQTESTQTEHTAEAKPQPELSKLPPEEPTQKPSSQPAPKRSEEAQKFIDMVETGAAKTWQWIKEGSKSLWDRAADLF